jgi:hypothetical protein
VAWAARHSNRQRVLRRAQPVAVPSLLELHLRREITNAWNDGVVRMYDTLKHWM